MKLSYITRKYPIRDIRGSMDIDIKGVEHNSKKITDKNLFIAQRGFTHDGHDYIDEAIESGAVAVVQEKALDDNESTTMIRVRDSVDALGYLAGNYYGLPWKMMKIIGITGTNGKTSVAHYIKSILNENKCSVGILGTLGANFGDKYIDIINTTPDSLEIQRALHKMNQKEIEYCVMEVSSHALDLKRVKYMDFHIGIFTNLSEEHLDFHKTMDNYLKSKSKLFYKTTRNNIINIDDPYGKRLMDMVKDRIPIITYGIKESAMVYASNIDYNPNFTSFDLITPMGNRNIQLATLGEFSVYNALTAAACGYALSLDLDIIKRGLENLKGIKGRLELIENHKGYNIIIDFAHTPKAVEQALKTVSSFTKGRIIVVIGAGGNRDRLKRPEMGRIVGNYADLSIITSDNPRFEDPEKIINDIIDGVKMTSGKYIKIVDRKEAIEYAIKNYRAGDTILLAGKGHEEYTIIDDRYYPFSERKIVEDIIKGIK
ncbi:MAG: UDP-N-acetylmuramoyl-L-alanyl-D-glutamate--2,6-diaminopimelate ligase [Tissierellaceae bacterium]